MSNKAWLVRPFPHNQNIKRLDEFKNKEIIAVGWPNIGDLSTKSREDIKLILSGTPYNLRSLALGNAYATVDILVNQMEKNDLVLTPDGDDIYFGKITSDYVFDQSVDNNTDGYPHQRNVKWLSSTSRQKLSSSLRSSLKVHRATADLTKHFAEIKALSEGQIFVENTKSPNKISVTYPLRPDFSISFDIPDDIEQNEAIRLSQYFETLYFK